MIETVQAWGEALIGLHRPVSHFAGGSAAYLLQLSFRFQSRGALAIYHGEQGLLVDV